MSDNVFADRLQKFLFVMFWTGLNQRVQSIQPEAIMVNSMTGRQRGPASANSPFEDTIF